MSGETQEEPLAGEALDSGASEKASDHESNENNDDPTEAEESGEDEIDFSQRPLHKLLHKMAKDKPQAFETDLDELRTLLNLEETEIDLPHTGGKTALHVAAENGLVEAARILIDAGASLAEKEDKERQPLHLACRAGHTEMARLLLEREAEIEALQYQHTTALDDAAYYGHLEVVELLLESGANSQVADDEKYTPLHNASYQGHEKIVRALLENNRANIDDRDGIDGFTALHLAMWRGHKETVHTLLEFKSRLDVQDNDGWTPLMTATKRFPDYVEILLRQSDSKTQLEIPDDDSYTPLLEASRKSEVEIASLLIAAGADCNAQDKCGRNALHLASKTGNPSIVSLLLETAKISIDAQSNGLNTPLHLAAGVRPKSENDADLVSIPDELIIDEYEYDEGQYGTIVRYLLEHEADPRVKNKDGDTALHYAAASGDLSRVEFILDRMNQEDMKTQNKNGWTSLHSAFKGRSPHDAMSSLLQSGKLDTADFGGDHKVWEEAVRWAAGDSHNHGIAKLLFKGRPGTSRPSVSSNWSVIEWAAHDQLPEVLEQLIDTSRNDDETEKALDLVLESIRQSSGGGVNGVNERSAMVLSMLMSISPRRNDDRLRYALESVLWLIERPNDGEVCEQLPRLLWLLITASKRHSDTDTQLETTLDAVKRHKIQTGQDGPQVSQIKPPPVPAQTKREKGTNKDRSRKEMMEQEIQQNQVQPDVRKGFRMEDLEAIEVILQDPPFAQVYEDSKRYELPKLKEGLADKLSGFMADVVQFYKGHGKLGMIRRKRPVQEVIYDIGPTGIMNKTMKSLDSIIGKESGLPGHTMDTEAGPLFTWVHLPTTNMDWMNDLMMRIMKDEQHDVWQFRDARSFFRDSWAEVPDESAQSRIMRPRTVTKGGAMDADELKKAGHKDVIEGRRELIKRKRKQEGNGENDTKVEKGSQTRKSKFSAVSATYIPYFCFSTNYRDETSSSEKQRKYEKLLKAYKFSCNHGSPTLDEWYYHFEDGVKSQEDKDHRNKTQVVTKLVNNLNESTENTGDLETAKSKPDQWTVLRVNQLWIWTLADKWLITATSCLLDDSHDTVAEEILRHLSKEAGLGGSGSQSASVDGMVETIVDYCIRMYEKEPKISKQASIGQTYSHHMNKLSRDETALFNEFRRLSESYQQDGTPRSSSGDSPHQASSSDERDDEIRTALKQAERLYSEIKDFRDEVNILSSAAQYQLSVQKRLPGNKLKDADLSASYVLEDLEKMDRVANRIELAVNATLSLQQSEISSRQATLATHQALQSTEQGKVLMAFTFATLLFLPLSFLSSLFALDVSSFQQTPAWVFAVLFLVAVAVSLFLGLVAINWNRTIPVIKARVSIVERNSRKFGSISSKEDRPEGSGEPHSEGYSWIRSRGRRKQQTNAC